MMDLYLLHIFGKALEESEDGTTCDLSGPAKELSKRLADLCSFDDFKPTPESILQLEMDAQNKLWDEELARLSS